MEYKGTRKHLPQIARELGVDGILEGSVIRENDQVRVTVQLLDGPNDRHIWSESYERPLHGVLNLAAGSGRGRFPADSHSIDPRAAGQDRLCTAR